MSWPRKVLLTEGERRALRALEEALTAGDPALSRLLDSATEPRRARRRMSWLLHVYVVLSVLLVLLGVGAADARLRDSLC